MVAAAVSAAGLWDEALRKLGEEERVRYENLVANGVSYKDVVSDVLNATLDKKEECKKKRWKVTIKGKTIILRDVLEKVAVWVNKFVAVGDSAVQYDPAHAALPWAAVRFILTATITEVEIFGAILQVVESISNTLARCVIMEDLYLPSTFEATDRLRRSLVELYASILSFLARSLKYYSHGTASRIAKSLVTNTDDVFSWAKPILEKQTEVDRLVALAEAERARISADNIAQVRAGQLSQDQKLDKTHATLLQLSNELKAPITRIDVQLSKIQDDLERQKRVSIIKAVSTINFVSQHKVANASLLPDSGKWFLNKSQFQEWRSESSSSILWLHGIPGSGKTKLTSMVVSTVKPTAHTAYFYCIRNLAEPERAECDSILLSLVRQLACPDPKSPILPPIIAKYEDALDEMVEFDEITWTREEIVQCLIELCDLYPAVTFVIDALDEINPANRLEFLDGLLKVMDESQTLIKIFMSSRENMDIVTRLESVPNLRIGAKENTEDITKFVHQQLKMANLLNGRLSDSLYKKVQDTLIEGAQGMFRWVDLQIQSLRSLKVAADIESRLGRLPQSLEESYLELLEQIEASGEHAFQLAVFTFQWLLFARKPLDIADFALLASTQSTETAPYTTFEVLDVCQNLVVSNDAGIFRFAHLSVREFLEKLSDGQMKARQEPHFAFDRGNAAIATACVSYLRTITQSGSNKEQSHLSTSQQMSSQPELRDYAANYWPLHVSQSGDLKTKPPMADDIRSFLISGTEVAPTFAHWCNIVVNDLEFSALPEIWEAAQLPPNPIWLAHAYDIIAIKHVTLDDKSMRLKAFLYAAEKGNTKVMLTLLAHGLDIKDVGIEAMAAATNAGHADAVEILLGRHVPCDPDWLLRAAVMQHILVVVTLVSKGIKNFKDETLHRAFCIVTANGDLESIRCFEDAGVQKDRFAVVRALKAGTPTAAMRYISIGFDYRGSSPLEQRTALHWAVVQSFEDVVYKLLEKNVDVNIEDAWGNSPLHLAAWKGRDEIVRVLLDHGADRESSNKDGKTALDLATTRGHDAVIRLLKGEKATITTKKEDAGPVHIDGAAPLRAATPPPTPSHEFPSQESQARIAGLGCVGVPVLNLISPTPPDSPRSPRSEVGVELDPFDQYVKHTAEKIAPVIELYWGKPKVEIAEDLHVTEEGIIIKVPSGTDAI